MSIEMLKEPPVTFTFEMTPELLKHSTEVAIISKNLARELELPLLDVEQMYFAGFYHDIGKMFIPEQIRNKPDKLTENESAVMKIHTYIGYQILKGTGKVWSELAANVALHHHENIDGSGYYKKQMDDIYFAAHIVRVADAYSALLTDRADRSAWCHQDAVKHIKDHEDTLFDYEVVDAFLKLVEGKSDFKI